MPGLAEALYITVLVGTMILIAYLLFYDRRVRDETKGLIAMFVLVVLVATAPIARVSLTLRPAGKVIYTTNTTILYQTIVNNTPTLTTTVMNATVERTFTTIDYGSSALVSLHLITILFVAGMFMAYSFYAAYRKSTSAMRYLRRR